MKVKTTYKGKFKDCNVNAIVTRGTHAYLKKVGEEGVEAMRSFTSPHDWKSRLTDSISWRTQRDKGDMGGNAPEEDRVSAPKDANTVNIGTACPYAAVREEGAGPHKTNEGHDEFIERMKDWFIEKVGQNPEDNGEGENFFWNIIRSIRQGQDAVPFASPAYAKIVLAAMDYAYSAEFSLCLKKGGK